MKLSVWMQENNRRTGEVAIILGVSEETITSWKFCRSTPQLRHMLKIKAMTGGQVGPADFPPTHDRRAKVVK